MLLAIEVELIEIIDKGGNPIGVRCDSVGSVRTKLPGVQLRLTNPQILKKVEHGHGKEFRKLRELACWNQSLTGFVLFVRRPRDTDMRCSSR